MISCDYYFNDLKMDEESMPETEFQWKEEMMFDSEEH